MRSVFVYLSLLCISNAWVVTPTKRTFSSSSATSLKQSSEPHSEKKASDARLGVIRLDYDYPPAPGDIDSPESFGYDVFYRVVPGLTFEMCQKNAITPEVEAAFYTAIDWLIDEKKVNGITGDCGFMMWFQALARRRTHIPIFMSALAQLPAVTCAYSSEEQIIILTANQETLTPMRDLIRDECGVDTGDVRYHIIGAGSVPGFEAVALGEKVNTKLVEPGIVKLCEESLKKYPKVRAFLFECTELPPYSDAVRKATGLPVFDAITACDFFINGFRDNKRFGLQNWQEDWDKKQEDYKYGQNLSEKEKDDLVNPAAS